VKKILPPVSKEAPRWLYEFLRKIEDNLGDNSQQLNAIARGENTFGGGTTISGVVDHGLLQGLYPDDDHAQYLLLRGRVGGQTANGSIDLSSSSSLAMADSGNIVVTASTNPVGTTWNTSTLTGGVVVPVNNAIIVVLSTNTGGLTGGSSSYHSTLTDSKGNTYQKLGEYTTTYFGATICPTVSIWFSLVTTQISAAGGDFLTATFSTTMGTGAIESRQFVSAAGASPTVVATSTGGVQDGDLPSLAISGLTSGSYLYIRGSAHYASDFSTVQVYTPTSLYTGFTTSPNHASVPTGGGNFNCSARGEFIIATGTGSTSDPTLQPASFNDDASLFIAISLTSAAVGDLILQSINNTNAAKIWLHNSTIYAYADFFNFRNAGGSTTLSYVRGSDGAFIGPVVSTTDLLDMAADTNGDSVLQGAVIYGNSTPKWARLGIGPQFSWVGTSDGVSTTYAQITHSWLQGLNIDDHTQYLNLNGRGTGQNVSSLGTTHGLGAINDVAFHGRLIFDPQNQGFNYVTNRVFDFRLKPTSNLTNYFLITHNYTGMGGGGTSAAILINASGTVNSEGSPVNYTLSGFNNSISVGMNTNCTLTEAVAGVFSVSSAAGSGTITKLVGGRFTAITTGGGTIASGIAGLEVLLGQGSATVTLSGISFLEGGSNFTGTVADVFWLNFGSAAKLDYTTIVNWTGIRIPAAPTNPTGTIRGLAIDNIKSHHVGPFSFGSTTTPTHRVEVAAGTTAIAPIMLTTGTSLTTAILGCIEFTDPDIFFTITDTTVKRKAFVLDDGARLTSGRVPFAFTNGRLIDDAGFLFTTGSGLTLSALNLITDTTTGMKIATATGQKLGFWNAAPIIQPTTAVTGATRVGGGGTNLTDTDTFDGYTVAQIVKALRNEGLLA